MTLTRKTPLARTGFKRKTGSPLSSFGKSKPFARKSGIKAKRKKVTVADGSKYLTACRGESCFLRIAGVCCGNSETVVPAHSNESAHGKGMGIKADHIFTIPACFTCHAWLDQGSAWRNEKTAAWRAAYALWEPVRAAKMGIDLVEAA